jgi:hypothetical protein
MLRVRTEHHAQPTNMNFEQHALESGEAPRRFVHFSPVLHWHATVRSINNMPAVTDFASKAVVLRSICKLAV